MPLNTLQRFNEILFSKVAPTILTNEDKMIAVRKGYILFLFSNEFSSYSHFSVDLLW
jgi:hypothetical protein